VICPKCKSKSKVYNSRPTDDGTIRRNRECLKCSHRYATIEVSADIKKVVETQVVAKPVQKQVVAKRRQKKKMYSASAIDRLSDDELLDALEKGLINPDDLD
jgi:transcriptional repressor NrdR